MDKAELLKSMLHDFINDRQEQAEVTLHQFFVAKSQEMTGAKPAVPETEPEGDPAAHDDE